MTVTDPNARYGLAEQGYIVESLGTVNGTGIDMQNNSNNWSISNQGLAFYVTDINGANGQYINPQSWMPYDAAAGEGSKSITPSNMGCAYNSGVSGTGGVQAGSDIGATGWIQGCKANPSGPN